MNNLPISGLPTSSLLTGDELMVQVQDGVTKQLSLNDLGTHLNQTIIPPVQGHYALLSNFYFTGGQATETIITTEQTNTWLDLELTVDPQGNFDFRPQEMIDANPVGHTGDGSNGSPLIFLLEGLTQSSSATIRTVLTFDPDEDNSRLDLRLLFNRHSGTTPSDDFAIEASSIPLSDGADEIYPYSPNILFFIGDTIDTNGAGDAGKVRVQVKADSAGTISVKELGLFIQA